MKIKAIVLNTIISHAKAELIKIGAALMPKQEKPFKATPSILKSISSSVSCCFSLIGEGTEGSLKVDFSDEFLRFIRKDICGILELTDSNNYEPEEVEDFILNFCLQIIDEVTNELKSSPEKIHKPLPRLLKGNLSLDFGGNANAMLLYLDTQKGRIYLSFLMSEN